MRAAAKVAQSIATLPFDQDRKLQLVMGKVLPAAMYGVEASPAASRPLQQLRSAIVRALDPRAAATRSVALACSMFARDPDPALYAAVARLMAFRRAWHMQSSLRP
eukprot:4404128-Alexandrium_andersonii.AAC.1